jgi:Fungal chitosanase of glycosyl hydrolase group 75
MPKLQLLQRIASCAINSLQGDSSAFFYESGLQIDADGAYRAYHPNNKPGLDHLANGGKPGNWWALVTDNGKPSGNPVIQSDTDPAPGYYISTTSLQDPKKDRTDPTRYVDSESINFFVLPGKLGLAKLGDFGVVIRPKTNVYDYAIYADGGPANKLGEGSIALAASLGIPSNPKNGGVDSGIITIVFPGTTKGWPLTQVEIDSNGAALFAQWGGLDKARQCFPDSDWGDSPDIQIATPA